MLLQDPPELFIAARNGNIQQVEQLLAQGVSPDQVAVRSWICLCTCNQCGTSANASSDLDKMASCCYPLVTRCGKISYTRIHAFLETQQICNNSKSLPDAPSRLSWARLRTYNGTCLLCKL